METYQINYHPKVLHIDLPRLGTISKKLLLKGYKKLSFHPEIYGIPLRSNLRGYWRLRIGDYRIIYEIIGKEVRIQVMGHRKEVYEIAKKRLGL